MADTQNLAGKKLGDYILREKLTAGGMAHIYLGEDEKLQRRAAIKVLTSDMAGNDGVLRERFERELRMSVRVSSMSTNVPDPGPDKVSLSVCVVWEMWLTRDIWTERLALNVIHVLVKPFWQPGSNLGSR